MREVYFLMHSCEQVGSTICIQEQVRKSQSKHRLSWLRYSVVFLSLSRQIPWLYLQFGH